MYYEHNGMMFNKEQMWEIAAGIESGLDVSIYADPKYNDDQMSIILMGMCHDLNVSKYADPKFSHNEMLEIFFELYSAKNYKQE